ncbi:MAG: 4Fe-4S dicluster domain-containing protein [Kiritimatiellia bacterium]|jgi:Pyruvate/2-oxoacid:ferredoxin oxidoreductase delta subunit|nr:4Fe-4S dicluster domain-containing protein [Kiritimatiellia bacterium]MDP6630427.1 4Fe-4S dicluster domain-containing protein [Kiritimatiellia bacterium]MDP6809884.1 4Fe-4S dicluster domain-containing protein [Kiritimatiellia bacterium]MDP7024276.1 4Fe-4S dicluster domain-containing protein [Kiritimatiellia bacterium]
MKKGKREFYSTVPRIPRAIITKKKTPKIVAEVDEANCTGCQVCVPFCPVDCIEPVPADTYSDVAIPPVHVRHDECIGCSACVRACSQLTWDAIRMVDKEVFEQKHGVTIE